MLRPRVVIVVATCFVASVVAVSAGPGHGSSSSSSIAREACIAADGTEVAGVGVPAPQHGLSHLGLDGEPGDCPAKWQACTIERVANLSVEHFRAHYKGKRPVVFSSAGDNDVLRSLTSREHLMASLGHVPVILSSSNSYSHDKLESTLGEYMRNHLHPQSLSQLANETFYLVRTSAAVWLRYGC